MGSGGSTTSSSGSKLLLISLDGCKSILFSTIISANDKARFALRMWEIVTNNL